MELRQRKRIKNGLPKFDVGLNSGGLESFLVNTNLGSYIANNGQIGQNDSAGNYTVKVPTLADKYNNANPLDQTYYHPDLSIKPVNTGVASIDYSKTNQDAMMQSGIKNPNEIEGASRYHKNQTDTSGLAGALGPVGSIGAMANADIMRGIDFVRGVPSDSELITRAGSSNQNFMGVGYQSLNVGNIGAAETREQIRDGQAGILDATLHGASAGSLGGPIGAAAGALTGLIAGGLFYSAGRRKMRRRIANAKSLANRMNTSNRASAASAAIQQNYGLKYGDYTDDILYANRGKDLKQPKYKFL